MEKPIAVGDLVQIVKPMLCCGRLSNQDIIFQVSDIQLVHGKCTQCGFKTLNGIGAYGKSGGLPTDVRRLKRIPPLEELESTKTDEPVKETA